MNLSVLKLRFEQVLLPQVLRHARVAFRGLACPDRRADLTATAVGLAWKWYVRAASKGKDLTEWPCGVATRAAWAALSGRRLDGVDRSKDVLSPVAQRRHGFKVKSLGETRRPHEDLYGNSRGQYVLDCFEERLHDNTVTPPDEAAAFRVDFPAWVLTYDDRRRRIIDALAKDERTMDVSQRFGISPARVSQLRGEFHQSWERFTA